MELWLLAGIWLVMLLPQWRRLANVRRHFRFGDVNAAKVVSTEPYMLAAFADLSSNSELFYPAIRIIEFPLQRIGKGKYDTGFNMAAIATYSGSLNSYKWDNFLPLVAQAATEDQAEVERTLDMIPEWQWALLNEGLFQIPKPYRPGLYPVSMPQETTVEE